MPKSRAFDNQRVGEVMETHNVPVPGRNLFTTDELPGRDISEIPHPFIIESIRRFAVLPDQQREKIRFIHLNHTNPALQRGSAARKQVNRAGMAVARQGEKFPL